MTDDLPRSPHTLWVEPGTSREALVARVAMLTAIEKPYSYVVPDELHDAIAPGKRVIVPFGRKGQPRPAFCVAVSREPWTSSLKPVGEIIDDDRLLSDGLLELGAWMARYYCCPLGRTLAAMIPEAIRSKTGFRTVRTFHALDVPDDVREQALGRSPKRRAVLELLCAHPQGLDQDALQEQTNASRAVLTAMIKAALIRETRQRIPKPAPDFDRPGTEPTFELNPNQQAAIDRVSDLTARDAFRVLLLFGVSGSGKTEVYIHAIRRVLAAGRQAILLVPEIALTTQIVERLASRFRDVALIHSGLTGMQRSLTWAAIARGEKRVIIGTRSAVFAPCPDLGLIVVDEEQEGSYKNQQSPRFHTRDVAIKRAQLAGIPVVLGSATPSLETWVNCQRYPHFERIDLPSRVSGLPMPAVEFIDMRLAQPQRKGLHLLSLPMERALTDALERGQQAVLLLNRRGYANYLVCARCRTPIQCPNCRVNMVFHQSTGFAVCHYCQERIRVPTSCPDLACQGKLIRWGMGTERVEEELRTKFPDLRIARADSDTMNRTSDYEELLAAFARRETDVLVGTQMIAKGLDFPAVAFVGVVNADTSLVVPDFRAAERTFQLVTQVAGRAGRAEAGGRVIVQSLSGISPVFQFAMNHDYPGFASHELAIRKSLGWPPFSRIARIVVAHSSDPDARQRAKSWANALREAIRSHGLAADILGPQTAPLPRLRNQYRYDFMIRAADAARLLDTLDRFRAEGLFKSSSATTMIDVDPVSLM